MQYRRIKDGYLLRLEKGEEVIGSLTAFVKDHEIPSGFITGIGAITNATLGIYDTEKNEYLRTTFAQDLEVGNLTANISYVENDEPFVHTHVTLSDRSLNAFAGHLFEATVSVTLEIYIRVFEEKIHRKEDPLMGFKFWQL